jgi:hypothetical protein
VRRGVAVEVDVVNEKLAELLGRQEKAICEAWTERLAEPARLAADKLQPGRRQPVQPLLREAVHLLEGGSLDLQEPDVDLLRGQLGPLAEWRINLCQGIEVLLTGEVVVRRWARCYLDMDDRETVEMVEEINRVFHQLIRVYCLQYCDRCDAMRQAREGG